MNENINQENYIVRKLKKVKSKLYQAYLVPFFVDFTFRMGAAILASYVGAKNATIISISLLTLTRIKAIKDLIDVVKGLFETEKIDDPTITYKKIITRDLKNIVKKLIKTKKYDNEISANKNNFILIVIGVLIPMLFDYFSMGIVAKYGASAAAITQIIDTLLHISSLFILFSSIKKIKEELKLFNENYYNGFKNFVNDKLVTSKTDIISKITLKTKLKDLLSKEKTAYDTEKIRRFLVDTKKVEIVTKSALESHEWEQFYMQFPNDNDNAERSIRKCDDKYMIITKIVEKNSFKNKRGYADSSRDTYSVEISKDRYEEFKKINGNDPIYRLTSYLIKFNKNTILLDVYKEDFKGLNIARVKFKDSKESSIFIEPNWFGREITYDPNFTGKHFRYTIKK